MGMPGIELEHSLHAGQPCSVEPASHLPCEYAWRHRSATLNDLQTDEERRRTITVAGLCSSTQPTAAIERFERGCRRSLRSARRARCHFVLKQPLAILAERRLRESRLVHRHTEKPAKQPHRLRPLRPRPISLRHLTAEFWLARYVGSGRLERSQVGIRHIAELLGELQQRKFLVTLVGAVIRISAG